MKWIKYTEEKPTESDYYFCKGKKGKELLYYNVQTDEWELGCNVAHNHFSDDHIEWLKE